MALDGGGIARDMSGAFLGVLGAKTADIAAFARAEAKKFAQSIETIVTLRAQGAISEEEARLHLELQRSASRSVLSSIEGLSLLAAEQAINAALAIVRDAVNLAIGFPLIPRP